MKNIFIILGLLCVAILQVAMMPLFRIYGAVPNLALILILFLVIFNGFKKQWVWIVILGLLMEIFSGFAFGLAALSMIMTAYLIDLLNINIFSMIKLWIVLALVGLGILLYDVLLIFLGKLFSINLAIDYQYVLIELVYGLAISIVLFYGFKKIFYQKQNRQKH